MKLPFGIRSRQEPKALHDEVMYPAAIRVGHHVQLQLGQRADHGVAT